MSLQSPRRKNIFINFPIDTLISTMPIKSIIYEISLKNITVRCCKVSFTRHVNIDPIANVGCPIRVKISSMTVTFVLFSITYINIFTKCCNLMVDRKETMTKSNMCDIFSMYSLQMSEKHFVSELYGVYVVRIRVRVRVRIRIRIINKR